jgi:hypothetical protein
MLVDRVRFPRSEVWHRVKAKDQSRTKCGLELDGSELYDRRFLPGDRWCRSCYGY